MDRLDCVIIGAGVVGLSIARSLALAGREVIVLEAEDVIASHTSSRNSEVIHAGIYYAKNSLKARLCVAGKRMLYDYCEEHPVPFRRIGKLIVATNSDERAALENYRQLARENGLNDLELMSAAEVEAREPEIRSVAGLWSPSTGIIDSHAYMLSLQADIESAGGSVVCRSKVCNIDFQGETGLVSIASDPVYTMRCNLVVNSAGLWASDVAAYAPGLAAAGIPATLYSKGHYYSYQGRAPFQSLIYPVASSNSLGIHATLDLSGGVRFGPDAQWVDEVGYEFDSSGKEAFVTAISKYYPGINAEKLRPAYTGIRPKLAGPSEPTADFVIQGESDHGIPGIINLLGIESPGLTASLAIGEYVKNMVHKV